MSYCLTGVPSGSTLPKSAKRIRLKQVPKTNKFGSTAKKNVPGVGGLFFGELFLNIVFGCKKQIPEVVFYFLGHERTFSLIKRGTRLGLEVLESELFSSRNRTRTWAHAQFQCAIRKADMRQLM